jgi:nucleoside-diphosphate-sugar epimerase
LRILVIGGTSGIGLQTVKLALERGHLVTAMARRPERMGMHHPGLTTMSGNILDAEAVQRAIADQDAIVIAIGMGPTRKPVTLFSEGTLNVLNRMVAQGVRRLTAVTGIGAGDTRGHGGFFYDRVFWPLALKTIYADKNRQEALIRDYGSKGLVDWTIVRPGFLTDDNPKYRYRVITDLQGVTADKITRADVAHFIVAALESEGYLDETPLLSE